MRRAMIKLSGQALAGGESSKLGPDSLDRISSDIARARASGVQIALVVGGGNLFRGERLAAAGMDRAVADHMGMLATVINGLALREALSRHGASARVLSSIPLEVVCESYSRDRAVHHLEQGRVVICVGGLGIPFFTTDSAAAERAAELGCDTIYKATAVDGVYDRDPARYADAHRFGTITHTDAISRNLRVMDTAAFSIARDNGIPIVVFSIADPDAISAVIAGTGRYTRVVPSTDDHASASVQE